MTREDYGTPEKVTKGFPATALGCYNDDSVQARLAFDEVDVDATRDVDRVHERHILALVRSLASRKASIAHSNVHNIYARAEVNAHADESDFVTWWRSHHACGNWLLKCIEALTLSNTLRMR